MAAEPIDPLRLLQEDLKDDDYETIITAISRLTPIALSLGPARVRSDLLPFLLEWSDTDNDEAQSVMAKQLNGDFVELMGGPAHGAALFPLLEKLAGEEEAVVRDAACESLSKVIGRIVKTDVATKCLPMLKRLANGDWFTTRVSACGLFAATYPLVAEPAQAELRTLFTTLCNDDTPMVRKAAFLNLGKFASVLQKTFLKTDIFPIIKTLSQDDLDSMRIYTIDACALLGSKIESADFVGSFLPIIEALQDDTSWRVRQQLARDMHRLCESSVNEQISSKRLLPLFAKLLRDREPEVRATACQELHRVAPYVKSGLLEFVGPCLDPLAIDPVINVRVCFAQSLCQLCPAFGKETSAKLLVPLIQQMAKDENFEVRNHIIGNIDTLAEALGATGLSAGVLPALLELSKDPKWRVRMAVVDKTSLLAKHLGVKTFEKKLQQVLIVSLSDHVFAIREKACEQIGLLVRQFGGKWAAEKFFPSAFAIYDKNTNYLHRMTCLLVIHHVASSCGAEVVERSLLPLVLMAAVDDVANVRIAGSKALGDLAPHLDRALVAAKIKPVLQKLAKDPDPDVAYFASQSLLVC